MDTDTNVKGGSDTLTKDKSTPAKTTALLIVPSAAERDAILNSTGADTANNFVNEVIKLITGREDVFLDGSVVSLRNWCYPGIAGFPNCDVINIE